MNYLALAALCAFAGVLPLLGFRLWRGAVAIWGLGTLLGWALFYGNAVSLVYPLFGFAGAYAAALWTFTTLVALVRTGRRAKRCFWVPAAYVIALFITLFLGSHLLNAHRYASLLGPVENRVWTQDVQPKDPHHMRMVSAENALYIARKAVANAGAIGSQFSLREDAITLQKVKGHLVYALPFDFAGFSQWQSVAGVPGYILVDAEDPERNPQLVELPESRRLAYTPGAFFGHELERHLREHGYLAEGLEAPRFELDDAEQPRWVVPLYRLGIWWGGETITGVAVVDPASGAIERFAAGTAPAWADRVFPGSLIEDYVDERGEYSGGWWNSFWAKQGLTTAERPTLVYGSDERLQWVTGVTSTSERDDSLIGLIYTDSHSGKSVYYRTNGGATDTAIMQAVNANQQVKFKHLHGSTPQIYNVDGVMTSVVPLLNDNHAYQGMALVRVANPQDVAVGTTQLEAQRAYQAMVFRQGQQIDLSRAHEAHQVTGVVDRIRQDLSGGTSVYLFHLKGVDQIFAASSGEFVKIALTQPGDTVRLTYVASGEDTVPVQAFDNVSLPLQPASLNAASRSATVRGAIPPAAPSR